MYDIVVQCNSIMQCVCLIVSYNLLRYEELNSRMARGTNIITVAKFYIHKCKFARVKPFFNVFKKEMELYIISLCFNFNVFI